MSRLVLRGGWPPSPRKSKDFSNPPCSLSSQNPEAVREEDGQLLGCLPPVLDRLRPLAPDSRVGQENQLLQGGVVREDSFVLGHLAQLAVIAFHRVGRVADAPYGLGIPEIGTALIYFLKSKTYSFVHFFKSFRSICH